MLNEAVRGLETQDECSEAAEWYKMNRVGFLASIRSLSGPRELPARVFFEPTEAFLEWADHQDVIVDCGAGMGRLSELLPRVICIDTNRREGQHEVALIDATMFPFRADHVALIARPSGGDWVHDTFDVALKAGATMCYVGLPKNYERDLSPWIATKLMSNAGLEGEELWEILKLK